jgi:uncharacterized membrane protein (UPF0127 family)
MKFVALVFSAAILILGVTVFIQNYNQVQEEVKVVSTQIGNTLFDLEIVDTSEDRKQGLSSRASLLENKGMLFVYEKEDFHRIWMKDMKFSIDIIWLSRDKEIIHIEENVHPDSYPEVFQSKEKSLFVIEVNGGVASKEGVEVGDMAFFNK